MILMLGLRLLGWGISFGSLKIRAIHSSFFWNFFHGASWISHALDA